MNKIIYLLLLTVSSAHAQEYLRLTQDSLIYDVEVVVFARLLSQPDATTIKTNSLVLVDGLKQLPTLEDDTAELFKPVIDDASSQVNGNDNWQVPVTDNKVAVDVLSWFKFPTTMNHPVVDRLQNNPTIKPLDYQKWRQPATNFLNPSFVYLTSNHYATAEDMVMNQEIMPNDFEFSGQIAYSKQKFDHVQIKLNYYRNDDSGNSITYIMDQKSRIELNEWQYFDHQQFGVLVKVSPITIREKE